MTPTKPENKKPVFDCLSGVWRIEDKIESNVEKRKGSSVITAAFCSQEMSQVGGYMFICVFTPDNSGG
jgi:hypothetical protein